MKPFRAAAAATSSPGSTPAEAGVVGLLLDQLEQLLDADADDVGDDPVLARLLPDGHRGDPEIAADYRELTEASLRSGKADDLAMVRATLPAGGGEVRLDADQAGAWLRTHQRPAAGAGHPAGHHRGHRAAGGGHRRGGPAAGRLLLAHRACRGRSSTHWSPVAPAEGEHDQQRQQQVEARRTRRPGRAARRP